MLRTKAQPQQMSSRRAVPRFKVDPIPVAAVPPRPFVPAKLPPTEKKLLKLITDSAMKPPNTSRKKMAKIGSRNLGFSGLNLSPWKSFGANAIFSSLSLPLPLNVFCW